MSINFARLSWQQDNPYASDFSDIYFMPHQGIEESVTVFLAANHLPQRWYALRPEQTFTIFEAGFGTGLNFFVVLAAWMQYVMEVYGVDGVTPNLRFISVEKHPLRQTDFLRVMRSYPQFAGHAQSLVQQFYPVTHTGLHMLSFPHQVRLYLWCGALSDVAQADLFDTGVEHKRRIGVDAWFLDGFAPAKNPDMWTEQFFAYMAQHSRATTTFGTFTAASMVRQRLKSQGFVVHKTKGFGHKRERLYGYMPSRPLLSM